jgi:hypothetical protein
VTIRSGNAAPAAIILAALAFAPRLTAAQTIRPIASEYQRKAQGRFELVNNADRPLNVILQLRGFTVDERGEMLDAPLVPGIHVRLSANSIRIPPRQSRWVFYDATADRMPAWFVVYASFSGFPRKDFNGLEVQLELPHIVFVLPKTHWVASDVHVLSTRVDSAAKRLLIEFENQGSEFGRLTEIEVQTARQKLRVPGFALFPGIRRRLEIPWERDDRPETILVRSKNFSFVQKIPLDVE